MAGIDPWRRTGDVTDDEALAIVRATRPEIRASAHRGGPMATYRGDSGASAPRRPQRRPNDYDRPAGTWVYERGGLPCRRCGTTIRARGQGDDNRTTYWCPTCQA